MARNTSLSEEIMPKVSANGLNGASTRVGKVLTRVGKGSTRVGKVLTRVGKAKWPLNTCYNSKTNEQYAII